MSIEYDQYLNEHIKNVKRGLEWMRDNLELTGDDITDAILWADNHDHSKWGTSEYNQYDEYFYGGNPSFKVALDFKYAWLHHQNRNPHHWQYWVLINDDPNENIMPLPIPMVYIYEMIADWWSFSWKDGNLFEIFDWYEARKDYIIMEQSTRIVVENLLERIKSKLNFIEAVSYIDGIDIRHSDDEEDKKYGLPGLRKYPLPDADHVRSAIRFFNYVSPKDEEELANAILTRAKEYGVDISEINVGDENRFKKYLPEEDNDSNH